MAREVVIVGAARTPIGAFQGALSSLTAPQLGAVAIKAALERAGVAPEAGGGGLMGNVLQAGVGQAPARQAAIVRGHPRHRPGHHPQQGVRLGPQGRHRRRPGHRARRRRRGGRGRHGVDVQRALLSPHHARRRPHGQRRDQGRDDPRRPLGRVRQRHMGMCAEACAADSRSPRRPGRVRARVHPPRHPGPEGGPVQGGDRPGAGAPEEGRPRDRRRRRGPEERQAGQDRRASSRSSRRTAPSPPPTPRRSTTARRRWC